MGNVGNTTFLEQFEKYRAKAGNSNLGAIKLPKVTYTSPVTSQKAILDLDPPTPPAKKLK